jgi:transposase
VQGRQWPVRHPRKVKTDRRDARALAEACLLGAYRPAHLLSDPQRHVRGRLGVRDALVHTRTRYISVIRALLRQHGYRVPSGSAEHFIDRVQALPLPGRLRSVVAPLLAVMRPLNHQLAYGDATIEHLAVQDPRVPRLRSVLRSRRSSSTNRGMVAESDRSSGSAV